MTKRLLALLTFCVCAAAAHSQGYDWERYENERYGFTLSFPADVFELDRAARQDDGLSFVSRDGEAKLLVGAFQNEDGYTPQSYQRYVANKSYPGTDVDYAPRGQSWFVLSGERDGSMYYEKVMFSCGGEVINSFAMVYPAEERGLYDPIVERMENSFRPGRRCG